MALDTTIGGTASDSYITLQEWWDYWLPRGVDLTQHGHDASHEADLRRAADWLDRGFKYHGQQQYQFQYRAWPRLFEFGLLVDGWPVDPDTIPQDIKDAQAELAYLIHEGATPFATVANGAVKATRSKAGPVESQIEYQNPTASPRYVAVETLLRPYLSSGGSGQVRLHRA